MIWAMDELLSCLPQLSGLTLPIDGLSREAVSFYTRQVKLPLASGYETKLTAPWLQGIGGGGGGPNGNANAGGKELWEVVKQARHAVKRSRSKEGEEGTRGWGFQYLRDGLNVTSIVK